MFGKGSKLYGISRMKCPRCHEGEMFSVKNPYRLKHLTKINERCDKCQQSFEPEPNFYYGAMYVSYAFATALFVFSFIVGSNFLGFDSFGIVVLMISMLLVLSPVIFRLSRVVWLHINVKYREDAISESESH